MDKRYFDHVERAKKLAAELKLTLVPAVFSVGYSNDLLSNDPNLAEGLPVRDQAFVVKDGVLAVSPDSRLLLPKPSFVDAPLTLEKHIATVRPGLDPQNARMSFRLKVSPFRCYHVSVDIKSDGYKGQPEIKALSGKRSLQWQSLQVQPTQDWTRYDVVFNSLDNQEVNLYFGDWSYQGVGTMQWRNWAIEEAPIVNLLRRPGTPLVVKDAAGKVYEESKDFDRVVDPKMGRTPYAGEYVAWTAPVSIRSRTIPEGTRLLVSWYHPAIIYDGQVSACCQDPALRALLADQAKRMKALFGASGYMMSHDEFRTFGWDEPCRASGRTPGQMLADNARFCVEQLRPKRAYVWNDMFDPFHNAVEGPYYLVNGPWTGSWDGLDQSVVIVNWNYGERDQSLKFFADRGHQQVIAGYYDGGQPTAKWLESAAKVQGVVGIMYTTWRNDYSKLEQFATEVRKPANRN